MFEYKVDCSSLLKVSAGGMGFLSIASSLLNIVLDDWKSPQNDVVILSGRNSHPRLRHFLDDSGKGYFGGLLLASPFPHKNHDFRNPGGSGQFGSNGRVSKKPDGRRRSWMGTVPSPASPSIASESFAAHAPGIWM
jgi:hypothetical protein